MRTNYGLLRSKPFEGHLLGKQYCEFVCLVSDLSYHKLTILTTAISLSPILPDVLGKCYNSLPLIFILLCPKM